MAMVNSLWDIHHLFIRMDLLWRILCRDRFVMGGCLLHR